jgi:hypothetical protein
MIPSFREAVKKFKGGIGNGLSCCPGEGQIHAAKTRREMDDLEALPRLPQSDADYLGMILLEQKGYRFACVDLNTGPATENPAPVLAV